MAPTGFVGQEPPRGKTGIMFRKNKPYFKVSDGQASGKRSPKISSSRRVQNSASVKSHHSGEHARRKTDNGDKSASRKRPPPTKLTSDKHKSSLRESPSLAEKPTQDRPSLVDECDDSAVANWIKTVQASAEQQREQIWLKTGTALPVRLKVPPSKKPSPSSPRPLPRDQPQDVPIAYIRTSGNFLDENVTGGADELVRLHSSTNKEIIPPATPIGWNLQWNLVTEVSEKLGSTSKRAQFLGVPGYELYRKHSRKTVRISAIAEVYGDGISNKESSETSSASFGLTFPVFDEKNWHLLRERDPSLPTYKKVECFEDAGDRDTDLWLGTANSIAVKMSSKVLIAHIPGFRSILNEHSQFCLGRGGFSTPRYAVSICANANRELVIEPADKMRNISQSTVDHTRSMKYNFLDFIKALHGVEVDDVANFRNSLRRIVNYLRCPAAIKKCLETIEDKQYSELRPVIYKEAREYLRFSHKYGAREIFKLAFHDVVMQAAGSENFERYLRGIPSAARFIVKMEMERWRMGLVFDNLWERAWAALEGEPQVPSDTS
ncbi:hypothetical protein SLS56_006520 [Neofusicoccum ribis]|uniref:Uncharacterized protein n=1 Tax=Neofusicoccum ribis TaxID=45134 RepID=A0ABR3SR42_9PEZI